MNAGVSTLSTIPPRRHAAIIPIAVPSTKASTNAVPTRKIEYGSVLPITSETGAGKFEVETPKSPVAICFR